MGSRRFLLTTFGSLGDLHPYLAIGQELRRRGHHVRVATQSMFRERVEAAGLEYHRLWAATLEEPSPELIRRVFAGKSGVRYLLDELLMPCLRTAYEDTIAAAQGMDLLVSHPITFATPLAAQKLGMPWVATQLAPSGILSAYDPPVWPDLEWTRHLPLGRPVYRALFRMADLQLRRWLRPVDELRTELGLPDRGNPFFKGAHSPFGTLALFSSLVAQPQPDWPQGVTVAGFPFYDQPEGPANEALEDWLHAGEPPIVFTLGSSAVMDPGAFFRVSAAAAGALRRRALLVGYAGEGFAALAKGGQQFGYGGLLDGNPDVFATPFGSYRDLFPQASVVVHQGGIGTTAEALRSGQPMLVVPFGVDQPDNAARVERLGVAKIMRRTSYDLAHVRPMLQSLLKQQTFTARAQVVGEAIRQERGAEVAANALEAVCR